MQYLCGAVGLTPHNILTVVAAIFSNHKLYDHVAVELVWIAVFVSTAAMLVGPLDGEVRASRFTALEVFLQRRRERER